MVWQVVWKIYVVGIVNGYSDMDLYVSLIFLGFYIRKSLHMSLNCELVLQAYQLMFEKFRSKCNYELKDPRFLSPKKSLVVLVQKQ